tara:strand:- start:37 stop:297 length:261 start_codon:yes stop_codon:yes gene_type:complete
MEQICVFKMVDGETQVELRMVEIEPEPTEAEVNYLAVVEQLNDIVSMYEECLEDEINLNDREDEFDFYYWATSDWLYDAIAETHPY